MKMESLPPQAVPERRTSRFPAIAVALLLIGTFVTIGVSRLQGTTQEVTAEPARKIRQLRFVDQPDGAVAAIDVSSGQLIQRYEGEQGFLRGALRAMARQRKLNGVGAAEPFELILHADGRLTLHDPATGTKIALESFGSRNIGVFAQLLG
ncbi:MAG: photosynthetic complex assembly protein PuhC [Burkholderiaceae bacterium]